MISERAAEIFLEARTLDPETRAEFVDVACADSKELLGAVESLLAGANESEAYFEKLAGKVSLGALGDNDEELPANKLIGSWRLLKRIGRGGMGAVYLAERADEQFEQQAALKILPTGLDTDQARARFLIERQILARLTHDNIARLLDGGVTDDGVPYFVMDYVEGLPIDEYCEQGGLGARGKLELVLDIARAVQYAHRNLVIHRDLKPSNVLVDVRGRVRLLDFGIAKMLLQDADGKHLTQESRRPATPAFASPEMLRGEPVDVTTDVYSIGALLYVLLTGRLPLEYGGLSLAEMHEHATTTDPEPVSRFDARLKGDLDAIVAKALARLPGERYGSVEGLANDIRNYLNGLPVTAKTPSALYRTRKFLSRHWIGAAFSAFAIIALASIAGLALRSAIVSDQQTRQIEIERDRAEQTKEFLISIFDSADPNVEPAEQTARQLLEVGRERIDQELAEQPAVQAELLAVMGSVYRSWRMAPEGREVLLRELELQKTLHGEDSAEYAGVLVELAVLTDISGDYDSSFEYASQALQISAELDDTMGLALAHERVGRILHLRGDFDSAGTHFRKALELVISEKGENAIEVSYVREQLANLLNHQQHYDEALVEFQKTLEVRSRNINGDSSEISPIYLGMGSALTNVGRLDEAYDTYEKGYAMNDRLYGPGNSYNLYFANGLGKVAEARGELQVAFTRYEEAQKLIIEHTPESPNLAFAVASLAKVKELLGKHDLAIHDYQKAAGILEEKLPTHWKLGEVKWRWGQCLAKTGRFNEAEPLILAGIEIVEKQWGADHEATADARAAEDFLYAARKEQE